MSEARCYYCEASLNREKLNRFEIPICERCATNIERIRQDIKTADIREEIDNTKINEGPLIEKSRADILVSQRIDKLSADNDRLWKVAFAARKFALHHKFRCDCQLCEALELLH